MSHTTNDPGAAAHGTRGQETAGEVVETTIPEDRPTRQEVRGKARRIRRTLTATAECMGCDETRSGGWALAWAARHVESCRGPVETEYQTAITYYPPQPKGGA